MKWGNLWRKLSAFFPTLWHLFRPWQWLLGLAMGVGFCAALIVSVTHETSYQASSTVEVRYLKEPEFFDPAEAERFYQTQYGLLKSNVLVEQLISTLDLEVLFAQYDSETLFSQQFSAFHYWFVLQLNTYLDLNFGLPSLTDSHNRIEQYHQVREKIKHALHIKALPDKRQIIIYFVSPDRTLAPLISDTLAQKLILLHQKHHLHADFNVERIGSAETRKQSWYILFFTQLAWWLSSCIGLVLAFILLRSLWDDSVRTPEDIQKQVGLKVLGVAPKVITTNQHELALRSFTHPHSETANAFRFLQRGLLFLGQAREELQAGTIRILQMTSSTPSEGKTTSSINLACSFAQAGYRVLLMDADLRRPAVHRYMQLPNDKGVSRYLLAQIEDFDDLVQGTAVPNLHVIVAGKAQRRGVALDLLSLDKMDELLTQARKQFDYVIVDGPPVIHLGDALVLAHKVDATLFTIAAGKTQQAQVFRSLRRLQLAKGYLAGVVLSHYVAKKKSEQASVFMLEAS